MLRIVLLLAGAIVAGGLWLLLRRGREDIVQLRDALTGEPLGLTKTQYKRLMLSLGTKDPKQIAKAFSEVKARKARLAVVRSWRPAEHVQRRDQMRMLQQLSKTIIALCLMALPAVVHAQTALLPAVAYYAMGEHAYENGDYEAAVENLSISRACMPVPELSWDLALAHYRLGNVYAAQAYLSSYVRSRFPHQLPEQVRKLADLVAAAVDEDMSAQGLSYACDLSKQTCGIRHWETPTVMQWAIWERTH